MRNNNKLEENAQGGVQTHNSGERGGVVHDL